MGISICLPCNNWAGLSPLLQQTLASCLFSIQSTNMAIRTKFWTFLFVTLLCLVPMEESSGCNGGQRWCTYAKAASPVLGIQSRKVLDILNGGMHRPTSYKNGEKLVFRELRAAPSGPDPLHHNGGVPKKPRSP